MTRTALICALLLSGVSACSPQSTEQRPEYNDTEKTSKSQGDGPFGLSLSSTAASLDVNEEGSNPDVGFYMLDTVPSPSSDFEIYAVVAHESAGICEIRAVSQTFESDSLGSSATTMADSLAKSLESKYGVAKKTDVCGSSEISCQNQFWAMSVMHGERAYGYEWGPKGKIREIALYVTSDDLARLSVRLDYQTGDEKKCEAAQNSARANNL